MQQDIVKLINDPELLKTQKIIIKEKDDCLFLIMNNKANSFNPDFIRLFHQKLNEIQEMQKKEQKYKTLILTSTSSKIFSAGLDLRFIQSAGSNHDIMGLLHEFQRLLSRLTSYGMVTIGMINGHCIGGGVMLAMACDYRMMKRTEKEAICLNEAQMGVPIPPGMFSVLKAKIPFSQLKDMVFMAKKYTSQMALDNGLIDWQVDTAQHLDHTITKSQQLGVFGQNFDNLTNIKEELYKEVLVQCNNQGLSNGIKTLYDGQIFPKM